MTTSIPGASLSLPRRASSPAPHVLRRSRRRRDAVRILLTLCLCMPFVWTQCVTNAAAAEPPITALVFAPDGASVVAGSQAGVDVYEWPGLQRQRAIRTVVPAVHELVFSPDGKRLAVAGGAAAEEGVVEILAWPGGESQAILREQQDTVRSVCWLDDAHVATASLDHSVLLWHADPEGAGPPTIVHAYNGHSRGVSAIDWLGSPRLLVTAGLDETVRVWEADAPRLVRSFNNHTRPVHALALRPGNPALPMIASASDDRTVRLWQPTIGRMVRFLRLETTPLAVSWLPDGSRLVVAATDGHVRLIDPNTLAVLQDVAALDGWAYSLAVDPAGRAVVVAGQGGRPVRVEVEADVP